MQILVQQRILDPVIGTDTPVAAPWPVRLFNRLPFLQRIPARLVGIGFRPEHVRLPLSPAA